MDRYFGEGMETNGAIKKEKKERKDKNLLKNCVYTHFSGCSFAHLLCVHTDFEQIFVFPLFFYLLTSIVSLHPITEIPVKND